MDVDQVIGGYKVRSLIATGQSSRVWEVVEMASGRHLALKELLPHAIKDKLQRSLLLHEAKVGQKLAHDHIIKIIKVNPDPKRPYFVMEFFPAGSMKYRIANKQVDFIREHAHGILRQMATALAYMHGSGWIHRDIKPDNWLVDSAGQAKLIDFAIAQRIQKRSLLARLLGIRNKLMGTRSYMPPEQILGEDLDARSDIYAFGASAYEIVTLKTPFVGATPQDLLNKHLTEKPITPIAHNPEVTEDFAKLVLQMLAKRKQDRPNNFHEILMKLKTIRVFKSQTPPGPRK